MAGPEVCGRWKGRPAVLARELAARVEEAPVRPAAGQGGVAGNSDDGALAGDVRHRAQQPLRVRVARRGEDLLARAALDDPPAVHDRDAVGELGHNG